MREIRPSGAYRWVECAAAPMLEAQFADERNDHIEGDCAHWLAALLLQHSGEPDVYINYQHTNGAYVTEEMAEAVALYVDQCRVHMGSIETLVNIPRVTPRYKGTPDYFFYDPHSHTLWIYDFKYGWGIHEPFENWQLISYAIGIIDEWYSFYERNLNVGFKIIQPRPYHPQGPIRTWKTTAVDLRGFANKLYNAYREAQGDNPEATSGPHCRYCRALAHCHTAGRAAAYAVDLTAQASLDSDDPLKLATELTILQRAFDMVKWRKEAVEEVAAQMAKRGRRIPATH